MKTEITFAGFCSYDTANVTEVMNGGADVQTIHKLQAACISCSVITVIRSVEFDSLKW